MTHDAWTVLDVTHHADGGATLKMRCQRTGVIKTENFPADVNIDRLITHEGNEQ